MANMSLETVVSFIILLVVAGVIISMVLTRIGPENLPYKEVEMQQMEFKNKCTALCTDTSSLDYCRYYFEGGKDGADWDGNGRKNELISIGDYVTWDVCEERIYCFSMVPCDKRFGSNPAKGCASALCQAYLDKYKGNVLKANEAVHDKIKPGTCHLPEDIEDNWFEQYFPSDVCGSAVDCNTECTAFVDQGCGAGSCAANEKYYNRTCTYVNYDKTTCPEEECRPDASCGGGGGGATLSTCVIDKTTTPYTITCNTNCNTATMVSVADMDSGSLRTDSAPIVNGVTAVAQPSGFDATFSCGPSSTWIISLSCTNPSGTPFVMIGCP